MASNYNMICRLCLSVKSDLMNIGSILMLYEKIIQLTNVPLFDGDGLPSTICSGCCKRITEFFKFRETCQSNFYILQKYHLLPQKSQNVLDFISTHTRFQENNVVPNPTNSTIRQNELNNVHPINGLPNGNERENTASAFSSKVISMNHTTANQSGRRERPSTSHSKVNSVNCAIANRKDKASTSHGKLSSMNNSIANQSQDQNNFNHSDAISGSESIVNELNFSESIQIKQEAPLDNFLEIQKVESLSCTPDIFQNISTISTPGLRESLPIVDMEMVSIPWYKPGPVENCTTENGFAENCSTDEDESNAMECEPMFKRIKIPANAEIRECRVLLVDCVKSTGKKNSTINIIENNIGEMSFTSNITHLKNGDLNSERRNSYCKSYTDKPDPLMINKNTKPDKDSSSRSSSPLNNKFVCSLCQKTFWSSVKFREHIKNHTLKRFSMTKSEKLAAYKFK